MCLHLILIYIVCTVSDAEVWVLTNTPNTTQPLTTHTHTHSIPLTTPPQPSPNPSRPLISLSLTLLLSSASGCFGGVGRGSGGVCAYVSVCVRVYMCVCGGLFRLMGPEEDRWPAEQKKLQSWITLPSLRHVRRNSVPRETPSLSVVTPNYHQQQHPAAPTAELLLRTDGPL